MTFKLNRTELAGSLGDLGTLIPLSVAMIILNKLSVTSVFLMVGLYYIVCGLYYKLPIPVQPLKVVAAIAIAYPSKITLPIMAAAGLIFGVTLLILAVTGLIDWIAKFFTRPIIRGIQLGLGLILISKGIEFILQPDLFMYQAASGFSLFGISVNPALGVLGSLVTLLLLPSKRFPAALIIVLAGVGIGIFAGTLQNLTFTLGPTPLKFYQPTLSDFWQGMILLVIPQIPLTLGNAIIGTSDTCRALFGENALTRRVTYRSLATSMGLANIIAGFLAAMPMCHGAGGLAAHHRFGARTGGSNLIVGFFFLVLALAFGNIGISLLTSIPNAVLGILLLFAGLELAVLIRDVKEKNNLYITLLVASIGFATTNLGIAFLIGIIVQFLVDWRKLRF